MRTTASLTVLALLLGGACLAAELPLRTENPITNGSFETLDAQGHPVDWEFLGDCSITEDAHSGKRAVLLQRSSPEGICGLNRVWEVDSGEQGTMLAQLKGGVRFWYKAEVASGPSSLLFYVIPMSDRPLEDTGEQRARFEVPPQHVGDGLWHEGALKYDFTGSEKVKWVHISPRLRGDSARMILDDITWVEQVGPIPAFRKAEIEEVEGREGDECVVKAEVKNIGDQPLDLGVASIKLPQGLTAQGGPTREVKGLKPDDTARVSWRVSGRRNDEGRMELSLTAGKQQIASSVQYAPELEVAGLVAEEFILAPNQPARVSLRLRNNGHASVRAVTADLQVSGPLSLAKGARRQTLGTIPPQTEASLSWAVSSSEQTPAARVQVAVRAANAEGRHAKTTLIVGPSMLAGPNLGLEDTYLTLGNERVRLVFPRAEFGYGIGILQRRLRGRWETIGKLPRLSRLVGRTPGGEQFERLIYAEQAREVPSPAAVAPEMLTRTLELLATFTDAAGANWTITETITLQPGADGFDIGIRGAPDRQVEVLALDGPMFYAGEGAPKGIRRLDAIFPGLEWLVEGEESSSSLDIAADHPHRIRYVPHPHMVTIPLMCARLAPPSGEGTTVALMWDHLRPYYADLNRPSAVFASPDRFEGHASTVMGIFAPSMPDYVEPNERTADTPMEVAAGEVIALSASLVALPSGPDDTALKAVKQWFEDNGVPDPNPLPHAKDLVGEIEFSMAGYLGALWIPEEEKWYTTLHGPALSRKPQWPPAFLYDLRMCLETSKNAEVTAPVRKRYDRVVELSHLQPVGDDGGFHFAGPAERLLAQADRATGLIRAQGEDGSWRFRARIETQGIFKGRDYAELGPDRAAEVGTCARNAWTLLSFARMTGDPGATEAGLKALAFMDQFRVPRAAQVWEVPVHTPDILASSDACEAYLEGYLITGDQKYLDKAVYWAWTGLPFLYTWDVEGFEFLKYASIPVFGATWFRGSWFGRPVQWNGLRYAYALLQLAEYDDSLDWAKIARGVTISAMYQQSTDEDDKALWPDNISAIDKRKSGWIFAPRSILKNVYKMMDMQPTPVTVCVPDPPAMRSVLATPGAVALGLMRITAAATISDASFHDRTLTCKVTYTPPQTGYVVICDVSKPTEVRVNAEVAAEVSLPRAGAPPCWRYLGGLSLVELRLKGSGEHTIELYRLRLRHRQRGLAARARSQHVLRGRWDSLRNDHGRGPVHGARQLPGTRREREATAHPHGPGAGPVTGRATLTSSWCPWPTTSCGKARSRRSASTPRAVTRWGR